MQQKLAQFTLATRNFVALLLIGIVWSYTDIGLRHVIFAEILASALGLALLLYGLVRHLDVYRNMAASAGWVQPDWAKIWRVTRNMYFSSLIPLTYSPQILILLTQ